MQAYPSPCGLRQHPVQYMSRGLSPPVTTLESSCSNTGWGGSKTYLTYVRLDVSLMPRYQLNLWHQSWIPDQSSMSWLGTMAMEPVNSLIPWWVLSSRHETSSLKKGQATLHCNSPWPTSSLIPLKTLLPHHWVSPTMSAVLDSPLYHEYALLIHHYTLVT